MQIEARRSEGAVASEAAAAPVYLATGRRADGEFHCVECGYGVIVRNQLPVCPMCRGLTWEDAATSPSARQRD